MFTGMNFYNCEKDESGEKNNLATPIIIGIVIGVVAAIGIAGGLAAFFICRAKKNTCAAHTIESTI